MKPASLFELRNATLGFFLQFLLDKSVHGWLWLWILRPPYQQFLSHHAMRECREPVRGWERGSVVTRKCVCVSEKERERGCVPERATVRHAAALFYFSLLFYFLRNLFIFHFSIVRRTQRQQFPIFETNTEKSFGTEKQRRKWNTFFISLVRKLLHFNLVSIFHYRLNQLIM